MSTPFKSEIFEQVNALLRGIGPIDRIKIAINIIQANTGTQIQFMDIWKSSIQTVAKEKGVKILTKDTSCGTIACIEFGKFRYMMPPITDVEMLNRHIDVVCALFIPDLCATFSTAVDDVDILDAKLIKLWNKEMAKREVSEEEILELISAHNETLKENRLIRSVNPAANAMSKIASTGGKVIDNTLTKFLSVATYVSQHVVDEIVAIGFMPANPAVALFNITKDKDGKIPELTCYDLKSEGHNFLDITNFGCVNKLKRLVRGKNVLVVSDVKVGDEIMGGASQESLNALIPISNIVNESLIKDFFVCNVWPTNKASMGMYRDFLDDCNSVINITKRRLHNQEILMHCQKIAEEGCLDDFLSQLAPHVMKAIDMEAIRMEYYRASIPPGKQFIEYMWTREDYTQSVAMQKYYVEEEIELPIEEQKQLVPDSKKTITYKLNDTDQVKMINCITQCLQQSTQKTIVEAKDLVGLPHDVVNPYGKNSPNRPGSIVQRLLANGQPMLIEDVLSSATHTAKYDMRWIALSIITGKGAYTLTQESPPTMARKVQ
jgi:hypothetical protein